jgi:hypothetical protein
MRTSRTRWTTLLVAAPLAIAASVVAPSRPAGADAAPPRDISRFACPADLPDPFTDIAGSVHEQAIRCLAAYELVNGTSPTTFSPNQKVTRGQLASFLVRMALEGAAEPVDQGFTDIAGSPHEDNINILAELGLVNGTSATTFGPNLPVTRAQAASMVARMLDMFGVLPSGPDAFVDDDGPHESSIDALAAAGIVGGVTSSRFNPSGHLTRGAAASILARTQDLAVESGLSLPPGDVESLYTAARAAEVEPGSGDSGAVVSVQLIRTSVEGLLCLVWDVDAGFAGAPTSAHVHDAAAAEDPIVLTLATPTVGAGSRAYETGCTADLDQEVIDAVFADPAGHYVDIHTGTHPDGAVRGSLAGIDSSFGALLTDTEVIPQPGETDAFGIGEIYLLDDGTTLCVSTLYLGASIPTGAHLHDGAAGDTGSIVATFPAFDADFPISDGCVGGLSSSLLDAIAANPADYYVDVHTTAMSGGAVRGQLESFEAGTSGSDAAPASWAPFDGPAPGRLRSP